MTPRFLRVGPGALDGRPVIEVELINGQIIAVALDRAHGRSVANRIHECVEGSASRRVLELELVVDAEAVPA